MDILLPQLVHQGLLRPFKSGTTMDQELISGYAWFQEFPVLPELGPPTHTLHGTAISCLH